MEWTPELPSPGDIIRTKVQFYYHYGIFVSDDEVIQFGLPTDPMRSSKEIRVLSSDVGTFLNGGELETGKPDREEKKKMRTAAQIVDLARSRLGEDGYDILHNNCEHFVNDCVFGERNSRFVDGVRDSIRQKLKRK